MNADFIIELPEEGGTQIKVTDKQSGEVIYFESTQGFIDLPNMTEADLKDIAQKAYDIIYWMNNFDGDKLINGDFYE
jgi:hypothetical protein